jgi:toxin ParE1/3/4
VSVRQFTVVWTPVAASDLERLAAHLVREAPLRAERLLLQIIARGESLEALSGRGRPLGELRSVGDQTRLEIQEPPWRIIYRIVDWTVEIHGVFDGRRSLEDILLERLIDPVD